MIRKALPNDAQAISTLALSLSSFLNSNTQNVLPKEFKKTLSKENYTKLLNDQELHEHFVYVVKNEIVGYISYFPMLDSIHIYHLFVHKQFHKQGIAKELCEHMFTHTASSNYTVNASLSSVTFYKKLGFLNNQPIQESKGMKYQIMSLHMKNQ